MYPLRVLLGRCSWRVTSSGHLGPIRRADAYGVILLRRPAHVGGRAQRWETGGARPGRLPRLAEPDAATAARKGGLALVARAHAPALIAAWGPDRAQDLHAVGCSTAEPRRKSGSQNGPRACDASDGAGGSYISHGEAGGHGVRELARQTRSGAAGTASACEWGLRLVIVGRGGMAPPQRA